MPGVVLTGTVTSISEDGRISLRHGPMPSEQTGDFPTNFPKMTHLEIPRGKMKNYHVGQKIKLRIEEGKSSGRYVRV